MDTTTRPGDTGHTTNVASDTLTDMTPTTTWQPLVGLLVHGLDYQDAVRDACGLPFLPFVECRGGAR